MSESIEEQRARLDLMAKGDPKWDLSLNDVEALRALLKRHDALEARVMSLAEVPCVRVPPPMKCFPRDPCSFCRARALLEELDGPR